MLFLLTVEASTLLYLMLVISVIFNYNLYLLPVIVFGGGKGDCLELAWKLFLFSCIICSTLILIFLSGFIKTKVFGSICN